MNGGSVYVYIGAPAKLSKIDTATMSPAFQQIFLNNIKHHWLILKGGLRRQRQNTTLHSPDLDTQVPTTLYPGNSSYTLGSHTW